MKRLSRSVSGARSLLLLLVGWFVIVGASQAVAAPPLSAGCNGGRTVMFGGINWESGEFITSVIREILERGYGCRTDAVPGNSIILEQALGTNDIQILAEEWVSRSETWNRAQAEGRVIAVGHPFTQAVEGWYVPDYLVHGDTQRNIAPAAPGLHAVLQLAQDKYVQLFRDPEQPTRGRFLNCPSGWTCEAVNTAKLHAYRLDQRYVDFRPGAGPAMDAAIVADYAQGRPLLFYYWSPSAIAGKLKLFKLDEPPFSPECWDDLTSKSGAHLLGCAAPQADIAYGVSAGFAAAAPQIIALLQKAEFPIDVLNTNLVGIAEQRATPKDQAVQFLRTHPELWRNWVEADAAARIAGSLTPAEPNIPQTDDGFPASWHVSIRKSVNDAVAQLASGPSNGFRMLGGALLGVISLVDTILGAIPWWLMVIGLMVLAWASTKRITLAAGVGVLMTAMGALGLWALMTQTLSLVLISSGFGLVIGLSAGIGASQSRALKSVLMPIVDVMQTMPSFVYLIPALMLFGLGKAPAVLATVIYCTPPMIRLTILGIEQVDPEIREAGVAFGLTRLQSLWRIDLPLARPTIMAGVNQMIMAALSMVVIASMIGARGLGEQVLNGTQTLDIGEGLEAGIGIVILAFVLDRITQGFGAASRDARR